MRIKQHVLPAVAVTSLVVALAGAAAAFAAHPIKGATYTGTIARSSSVGFRISFKVSANGKRVSNFSLQTYPVYCQGGGFGSLQQASGAITKRGTFSVKLPIFFAPRHQHQGFVIVTGRFGKDGRESGKVRTDFTHVTTCNGTSSYTTSG